MQIIQQKWREQRLHFSGRHTFLPYYTGSPWLAGEERFLFFSVTPEFDHPRLGIYNPATRNVEIQFDLRSWDGGIPDHTADALYGSRLWREQNRILIPRGAELYSVALETGECRLVRREDPVTETGSAVREPFLQMENTAPFLFTGRRVSAPPARKC